MRVSIKLFAILRERSGVDSLELDLPTGTDVAAVRDAVAREFPALASVLAQAVTAVNQEYRATGALAEGDEVALIPPVSGG